MMMGLRHLIAVSTVALAFGLASPAVAQNTNDNTNTNTNNTNTQNSSASNSSGTGAASASASASSNGVTTTTNTDNSQDNDGNGSGNGNGNGSGNDRSQDNDGNGSFNGNQDNDHNGNTFSDSSQDNDHNGNTYTDSSDHNSVDDGSVGAAQGGEVDTVADEGSIAASRGGEVEVYGDGSASTGGMIGSNKDSNNQNGSIIADQELTAIISNDGGMEAVVDDTQGYDSGNNSVRGNAFAAFAGILSQGWNTGVNSNTQSGVNIAAGATINFGDAAGGNCPGNSCH